MQRWLLAVGAFLLITGPGAVDAWLSLVDRIRGPEDEDRVTVNLTNLTDVYQLFFPMVGLLILVVWLALVRRDSARSPTTDDDRIHADWNRELYGADRKSLDQFVRVVTAEPRLEGLLRTSPYPYVDIEVAIMSAAIGTLQIDTDIKGRFRKSNSGLVHQPHLDYEGQSESVRVDRGHIETVVIRQPLSPQEQREIVNEARAGVGGTTFSFDTTQIHWKVAEVGRSELEDGKGEIRLPKNIAIHVPFEKVALSVTPADEGFIAIRQLDRDSGEYPLHAAMMVNLELLGPDANVQAALLRVRDIGLAARDFPKSLSSISQPFRLIFDSVASFEGLQNAHLIPVTEDQFEQAHLIIHWDGCVITRPTKIQVRADRPNPGIVAQEE